MGIFSDGNDEDDELFDLFMLNEINKDSNSGKTNHSSRHSGGCLTSLLLMISVPVGIIMVMIARLV